MGEFYGQVWGISLGVFFDNLAAFCGEDGVF